MNTNMRPDCLHFYFVKSFINLKSLTNLDIRYAATLICFNFEAFIYLFTFAKEILSA